MHRWNIDIVKADDIRIMEWRKYLEVYICLHLILLFSADGTASNLIVMHCPKIFNDSADTVFSCIVDTEGISNVNCVSDPSTLSFEMKRSGQSQIQMCTVPYSDSTSCDNSPSELASGECACTKLEGGLKTYTFKFFSKKSSDNKASFTCTLCATKPAIIIPDSNCNSLTFDDPIKPTSPTAQDDNNNDAGSQTQGSVVTIALTLVMTGMAIGLQMCRYTGSLFALHSHQSGPLYEGDSRGLLQNLCIIRTCRQGPEVLSQAILNR